MCHFYLHIYILKRFMVLTSSLGELMEDQMLQYYQIVLNINDRAFTCMHIYTHAKHTHAHTHTHTHTYIYIYYFNNLRKQSWRWQTTLDWYSLNATCQNCFYGLEHILTGWNDKIVTLEKTIWLHFHLMKTGFLFLLLTIY